MKIKYTIYWFEDKNEWLTNSSTTSGILSISKYLEDRGFKVEITFFTEQNLSRKRDFKLAKLIESEPEKYIIKKLTNYKVDNLKDISFINIDLILMDFYLGSETGNDVISYIRSHENDIYTDILFYSQSKSERDLRRESDKDGLYCSNRAELFSENKIQKIIRTTIKKAQDLNNLRGLVMAETSELDEMMRRILILVEVKNHLSDPTAKNIINGSCSECLKPKSIEFKISSNEVIFKFKGSDALSRNIKNATSDVLYKQVKSYLCSTLYTEEINIDDYQTKIRKHRINLAHYPEKISNANLMRVNSVEYNEKLFIDIRKDIQEYKNIFQEIIDNLSC